MGNFIYNGQDITANVKSKEKAIIKLYAAQKCMSFEMAEEKYSLSRLKKVIRDVQNGLWSQSEYFILERYSEFVDIPSKQKRRIQGHNKAGKDNAQGNVVKPFIRRRG